MFGYKIYSVYILGYTFLKIVSFKVIKNKYETGELCIYLKIEDPVSVEITVFKIILNIF